MSRNSKSARLTAQRKQMSAQRKNGNKGPAKTTPCHGKKRENCLWYKYHNNIATKKQQREDDAAAETTVVTAAKKPTGAGPRKFPKKVVEPA